MRLKRVRIFGFKTFADRTELNVDGGVIAVVGPNGCGKSNLVDAILWGLGEGNARQLRAQTGQDVIFSGSSKRKPVGFAEVSLLFDNEDGALPVESPEVSITRRLTRSGDSDYTINRQSCRQRDIYDLLADSGLGRSGYAIVGQKDIDNALSASAEDRRAWLDEAAGVQRYRARKIESLRRLSQAEEHLQRVTDILTELRSQEEPLRDDAETARRYKSLVGALREIEVGLLVNEAAAAIRESGALEIRIQESMKLAHEENKAADEIDEKIKELGQEISNIESEMDTVRGLRQGSLTSFERAEADLRLADQRLANLDEQEKSLSEDEEATEATIAEARHELQRLEEEEKGERVGLEELRQSTAGLGADSKRLTDALKAIERELHEARAAEARRLKNDAEQAQRDERRKMVERELAGVEGAIPELEKAVAEAKLELAPVLEEIEAIRARITGHEEEGARIRKEEDQDAQTQRKVLGERASLEGRRRGIEATIEAHEGLTQGSRAVLEAVDKNLLHGIYLPVGQAIETKKEYALAIETALGGSANDLIVEYEREAKEAIEWLKRNRAGRCTFQPIPLMRPSEQSMEMRRLRGERAVVGRASDLVECEAIHRPVIDSLLGRILIVETLDDALRLAKTGGWSRLVTLDGEVIFSGGAVSGGQSSRQSYGLVQRNADLAEIGRSLSAMAGQVEQCEKRSRTRMQRMDENARALAETQNRIKEVNRELQEGNSFVVNLEGELKTAVRDKDRLNRELESLKAKSDVAPVAQFDLAALDAKRDEALRAVAAAAADSEQAVNRLKEAQTRLQQAEIRRASGFRRLQSATEAKDTRLKRLERLGPEREKIKVEREKAIADRERAKAARAETDARFEKLQLVKREHLEKSLAFTEDAKRSRDNAASMADTAHQADLSRARLETRKANSLQRLLEEYGIEEGDIFEQEGTFNVPDDASTVVGRLRREIRGMGDVNVGAIDAYDRLKERLTDLTAQDEDIRNGIEQVMSSIRELDGKTRERFLTTFHKVEGEFEKMFEKLFGGGAGKLSLSDPQNMLESGVDIDVTLPGKKKQPLALLSGGERSLCASAFLFSLLKVKPSPLVVLDEVDAPLDGRNVERFAAALQDLTDNTQFIVITHNPATINAAAVWVGVTMQEPGISMLAPVRLPPTNPVPA